MKKDKQNLNGSCLSMQGRCKWLLALGMLLLLLTGCGSQALQGAKTAAPADQEIAAEDGKITLTGMDGRTLELPAAAKKVVALQASDVEILYALGVGDRVVGVGEYCNYPAEALKKTVLASGADTNIEEIIALDPDLLIMGSMAQSTDQVAQLENAGIKVLVTDAQNIAGAYTAIQLVGQSVGRLAEAETLIATMKSGFADLQKKAADKQKERQKQETTSAAATGKTLYFEVSPLEFGLWTTGQQTFMQEIADLLGVKNIFDDVKGWTEVSEEQVIQRDPDYIVTITMYRGEGPSPETEILGRKGWEKIKAVKNQTVFHGDSDQLTRPGPRLVEGAAALFDFIYGK